MSSSPKLDDAIRVVYSRYDDAVDEILVHPSQAEEFAKEVRGQSPDLRPLDTATILRRTCALRKRGEDRGGLPRHPR
jgi:hypothetical protein